tara:strand:+ start:23608 stop:24660 length:1053 start_codon:yes stop_codon:yes gene_type:complete
MTVYIVDIEAVDTRYTAQWKKYLPVQLQQATGLEVKVISGGETPQATTPGAFLNFGGTNVYKSNQLMQIGEMFCNGTVKDGDYFLYTDAWNPTVIQLKYMAQLLDVDIKVGGMWHAGSYDPADFLGRLIGNQHWVRYAEASMFNCYDHNYFATQFHIDMFCTVFGIKPDEQFHKIGWPMEYLKEELAPYANLEKENIILFPHRIAEEKQPEMFRELGKLLPDYEFVLAQEKQLNKHEYHTLLGKSKIVFSANLQETLGISWYEAALVGTIPMIPERLSYKEMAIPEVLYPTQWTLNTDGFTVNKGLLAQKIKTMLVPENLEINKDICKRVVKKCDEFFNGEKLYKTIKGA